MDWRAHVEGLKAVVLGVGEFRQLQALEIRCKSG